MVKATEEIDALLEQLGVVFVLRMPWTSRHRDPCGVF